MSSQVLTAVSVSICTEVSTPALSVTVIVAPVGVCTAEILTFPAPSAAVSAAFAAPFAFSAAAAAFCAAAAALSFASFAAPAAVFAPAAALSAASFEALAAAAALFAGLWFRKGRPECDAHRRR